MNWDWDKLQEKRQRQNWGNSSNNSSNNNNNNKNDEEPPFGSGSAVSYTHLTLPTNSRV